jgi:hypothetical protein
VRVLVVADMHLSPTRAYAQPAWEAVVTYAAKSRPALVVSLGDMVLDAPDDRADRDYARGQLDRLAVPWVAVPGNHDIGDCPPDPWQGEYVTENRLAAYLAIYGSDHFLVDWPGWRLVGANAQLLGSDLSGAEAHWKWLEESARGTDGRVALFMHKTPCRSSLDEAGDSNSVLPEFARRRLAKLLRSLRHPVVFSAHLHRFREFSDGEVNFVWAPTTGLINTEDPTATDHELRNGVLAVDFEPGEYHVKMLELPGVPLIDYGSLPPDVPRGSRFLPPRPVASISEERSHG